MKNAVLRIPVSDLRAVAEKLFDHLEHEHGSAVELSVDYYWQIPDEARYNAAAKPTDFVVGQLSDDWSELKDIMNGSGEPVGYALVWLAAVLEAIGEKSVG